MALAYVENDTFVRGMAALAHELDEFRTDMKEELIRMNGGIDPRKAAAKEGRMFWNKTSQLKSTSPTNSPPDREELGRILHTWAALITTHPDHFMDVSWLPVNKQKMIEVFKLSWLLSGDDKGRKIAEDWWHLLTRFQPGVGEMPLVIDISKDNPTVKVWRERNALVTPLLEKAIAEVEIYNREIERFKASNKKRTND
jgi:hypothetical protein